MKTTQINRTVKQIIKKDVLWAIMLEVLLLVIGFAPGNSPFAVFNLVLVLGALMFVWLVKREYTSQERTYLGFVRWMSLVKLVSFLAVGLIGIAIMITATLSGTPAPSEGLTLLYIIGLPLALLATSWVLTYKLFLNWTLDYEKYGQVHLAKYLKLIAIIAATEIIGRTMIYWRLLG